MLRSTRRLAAAALGAAAVVAAVPLTAHADTTLTVTALPGALSVAGVGTATGNVTPGAGWTALTGVTTITVSDLRGSTAGWHVTAQFADPVAPTTTLGGPNVRVSTSNPLGDAAANLHTFTDVTLSGASTILNSYGAGTVALNGSGISTADASFKVQLAANATGTAYGGSVVYTVVTG
jgi:hypothetical protein